MANKHFPQDMIQAAQMGKMCFLSDIQSPNPTDCQNCGGLGYFILFIATEGPYREPANPYREEKKTSKWHDGRWWVGMSYSFKCPDCMASGESKVRYEQHEFIRKVSDPTDNFDYGRSLELAEAQG